MLEKERDRRGSVREGERQIGRVLEKERDRRGEC